MKKVNIKEKLRYSVDTQVAALKNGDTESVVFLTNGVYCAEMLVYLNELKIGYRCSIVRDWVEEFTNAFSSKVKENILKNEYVFAIALLKEDGKIYAKRGYYKSEEQAWEIIGNKYETKVVMINKKKKNNMRLANHKSI